MSDPWIHEYMIYGHEGGISAHLMQRKRAWLIQVYLMPKRGVVGKRHLLHTSGIVLLSLVPIVNGVHRPDPYL